MPACRLLVGLAAALLFAVPVRAEQDPVAKARQDAANLRGLNQKPSDAALAGAASASFGGEREAAGGFVDLVRKFPDQRMEYCAYIVRGADGRFHFSPIRQGDMNRCPADRPKPERAAASVHTHPLGGRDGDASAAGQVFSEGDFAFAESDEIRLPIYLGAPAGHVLRYVPGGTSCKGESFVRREFEIVRDARPSVRGQLPINPGADMPLYDVSGHKQPKPAYCRPR